MTTTWVIYRYPTISTRVDAEFYDEVTCDKEVAVRAAHALQEAYSPDWWFYVKNKAMEDPEVIPNWEDTGAFELDTSYKPPVGDALFDSLQEAIGYTPKSHHFKYHAKVS